MGNAVVSSNRRREHAEKGRESLPGRIRDAVLWRSGGQILAQAVQWCATFLVIRILDPRVYGLFAMAGVVVALLNMLNGHGLARAIVQRARIDRFEVRQLFGMLIALNAALALAQIAIAPLAAAYYGEAAVAPLLRVQALLYLTTPFIVLPHALLSRTMDFRRQAHANVAASMASAMAALTGASLGWGVWTLVVAPLTLFAVRGTLLTWYARSLMRPSFDFRGASALARYGGLVAAAELFWILQTQLDVMLAGGRVSAHSLGLYTTALFLSQLFIAKVVPPLNEVAFSAYARLSGADDRLGHAFLRAAGVVMVLAAPCQLGIAAAARPLVLTMLGEKWAEMVPLVRLLALAMPFVTIQVLLPPACDARGRPGLSVSNGAIGTAIVALAFSIGLRWGVTGLAWSWLAAYPLYLAISLRRALPVIGAGLIEFTQTVTPPCLAAIAMAAIVTLLDYALPPMPPPARLAILAAAGASIYGAWLAVFARGMILDLVALARRRQRHAD